MAEHDTPYVETIGIVVSPELETEAVINNLNSSYAKEGVSFFDDCNAPCIHIVVQPRHQEGAAGDVDGKTADFSRTVEAEVVIPSPAEAFIGVSGAMAKGEILLPTPMGVEKFAARLRENYDRLEKLRKSNHKEGRIHNVDALPVKDYTFKAKVKRLHFPTFTQKVPDLAKVLKMRAKYILSRELEGYYSYKPRHPESVYWDKALGGDAHHERISSLQAELEALGLQLDPTDMSYSQLNTGLPFPGRVHREREGVKRLNLPEYDGLNDLVLYPFFVGAIGMAEADGIETLEELSPRVSVKPKAYMGPVMNSKSHLDRKTLWRYLAQQPKGIFALAENKSYTTGGFRTQGSKGKKKMSFLLIGENQVLRSNVLDKEDMLISASEDVRKTADKDSGRKRFINNAGTEQNDSTTPVAAHIAETKGGHYKKIFQPDETNFLMHIPGTVEFKDYWTEVFEIPLVKEVQKAKNITDSASFTADLISVGEWPLSGDLENYDGNCTMDQGGPLMKELLAEGPYKATENMWFADIIGVYVNEDGEEVYYYVEREVGSDNAFDFVASGIGLTSPVARLTVPKQQLIILKETFPMIDMERAFGPESYVGTKASGPGSAFINNGDDHTFFTLYLYAITGIHPKECQRMLREALNAPSGTWAFTIAPEEPQMNSGFKLHVSEKNGFEAVSLSAARLWTGTVFPEHARSAIGLFSSLTMYMDSAIGTPEEDVMRSVMDLILTKVYRYKDLGELEDHVDEDMFFINEQASKVGAARDIIALQLGIKASELDWKFSDEELLERGVSLDLLEAFRQPIPSFLTKDFFKFMNRETFERLQQWKK